VILYASSEWSLVSISFAGLFGVGLLWMVSRVVFFRDLFCRSLLQVSFEWALQKGAVVRIATVLPTLLLLKPNIIYVYIYMYIYIHLYKCK